MRTLLIASNNSGKIREIKEILQGIPYEIKSLKDIELDIDVKETGKTFAENAILKAKTIGEKTGLLTLADDSGLEVDALNGMPGVYSARYADGLDLGRVEKILQELKGIPREKRTAQFRCVIAVYNPETNIVYTFEGISKGFIADKPVGKNGFDYDPIFFNPDLGKTNGEATLKEKNRVSHRAKALVKTKEFMLSAL